jgi:lactate dehydrogenase-like 2-hydroxyacid dehydrogenase
MTTPAGQVYESRLLTDGAMERLRRLGRPLRVGGDRFLRSRQPWSWGPRMLTGIDVGAGAALGILGYGCVGRAVASAGRSRSGPALST